MKGTREHLQMYLKIKQRIYKYPIDREKKMPSDATHPTSAQSILKPENILCMHRRKAVFFLPT